MWFQFHETLQRLAWQLWTVGLILLLTQRTDYHVLAFTKPLPPKLGYYAIAIREALQNIHKASVTKGMACDVTAILWNPPKIGMASMNIRAYPPARSTHINQLFETPAVVRNTLPPYMCRSIHNYSQLKIRPAIDPVRRHRTLAPVRLQTNFNSGSSGQRD